MPTYAYRCRECTTTFDVNRPMSEASAPAACPEGHDDTVKLLTTVALTGRSTPSATPSAAPSAAPAAPAGGGCCGGGCCG